MEVTTPRVSGLDPQNSGSGSEKRRSVRPQWIMSLCPVVSETGHYFLYVPTENTTLPFSDQNIGSDNYVPPTPSTRPLPFVSRRRVSDIVVLGSTLINQRQLEPLTSSLTPFHWSVKSIRQRELFLLSCKKKTKQCCLERNNYEKQSNGVSC